MVPLHHHGVGGVGLRGERELEMRSALKVGPDIIGSSKNRLIAIRLQHLKLNIYHFC